MRGPTRILVACVSLALALSAVPASAHHRSGPCNLHRRDDETVRQHSKRLIRCAADRWPVRGGAGKAVCIAKHESGLDPKATSPGGAYLGLFQHSADAWPDRFQQWTKRGWDLSDSALSGRTNTIVTIRMASANGWGPWAGVDGC